AQRRINSDPERWARGWHGVTRMRQDLLFHAGSKTEVRIRKVACQSLRGAQSFQLKHDFHFFSSRILWIRVEKESFFQPSSLHKMLRALRNTSQERSRKTSA
ncbi:S-adenosylmethionine decarboxylase proenzyme, partial [Clarias magur]